MAAETQYTANTGMATISTANSNLDGSTGAYSDILTAAASGTLIKSVTIKAQGDTTQGMIRLFAYDGTNTKIIAEVEVPEVIQSTTAPAFETTIFLDEVLVASGKLKASTEKGNTTSNNNTFNIIAEGLDWTYYTTSIRPESAKYTANTGMATMTTANSYYDILTAASNGTLIQSVTIKAQVNTTVGMVRLFLYDGTNTKLLTEVPVAAITKSIVGPPPVMVGNSFSARVDFNGKDFALKSGWKLRATTQNAETFNVIAEGLDWAYPA